MEKTGTLAKAFYKSCCHSLIIEYFISFCHSQFFFFAKYLRLMCTIKEDRIFLSWNLFISSWKINLQEIV